ncbi:MAG: CPBP family intramembrane glutamic endopeptidase [Phycisphaerae bacterium]
MIDPAAAPPPSDRTAANTPSRGHVTLGITLAVAYSAVFLVPVLPPQVQETAFAIRRLGLSAITALFSCLDGGALIDLQRAAYYAVTMVLIPWASLALWKRGRPRDLGLRIPNRFGWRILVAGYVPAVPFLWWMTQSPGFARPYQATFDRGGVGLTLLHYLFVFFAEHFFFHGVLLAICRSDRRWPSVTNVTRVPDSSHGVPHSSHGVPHSSPQAKGGGRLPPVLPPTRAAPRWVRSLQWIGLGQPAGGAAGFAKIARRIGLPPGCGAAVVCSGLLFAAVHLTKDPRELLLSLPGGLALAYIAYRTNSLLTPFVLHMATAATAALFMFT